MKCYATYVGAMTKDERVTCDRTDEHVFHRDRKSGAGWRGYRVRPWTMARRTAANRARRQRAQT